MLVCESILGENTRLLFYGRHTVSGLRVCSFERDNDTQAYLQSKNERDNATQAYLQRKGERENAGYGNVTLAMVTVTSLSVE